MPQPKTLVLTGYGVNCDEETRFTFESAGASAQIMHINDLIEKPGTFDDCQILAFPGGFSYGDDTGSGKAFANRIRNNLHDEFSRFLARDVLVIGICNGFQVLANLGIVPGFSPFGNADISLERNTTDRYQCRWVNLAINKNSNCVFTRGIDMLHVPVAHGEGNFFAQAETLSKIESNNQDVLHYVYADGSPAKGEFPVNPNGALHDVAGICDTTGRIMGLMPHPERNIFFTQRDDWTKEKERLLREGKDLPSGSEGMKIFANAVEYFSR
jgi:phosphoribosylformylglycinamidine synthase subunit PurQ / glutaminase